jgi:hypothetical protein
MATQTVHHSTQWPCVIHLPIVQIADHPQWIPKWLVTAAANFRQVECETHERA